VVVVLLRQRIAAAIGVPTAALEDSQILHYATGETFRAHYDWLDPADPGLTVEIARFGQRIATFLVFLNEDFEGGATAFPALGIAHRGGTGDALYFGNLDPAGAPDRRTLHVGEPPTVGEKWAFSQWVRSLARL
jgi:prolyl 4-hydroxylase